MNTTALSLCATLLLSSCGIDPDKIPDHILVADDGMRINVDGAVSFGVLGNARESLPGLDRAAGRAGHPEAGDSIIQDIAQARDDLEFVVMLGDMVRSSSTREWRRFDQRWASVLDGVTPRPDAGPNAERVRLTGVPVAGDREAAHDKRYRGLGGSWPAVGAAIGYNRVGSWYWFDISSEGTVWRFMVLDTGKARLGSRWNEERNWIKRAATQGHYDDIVVFMHDPVVDLAGHDLQMNIDDGPRELIELLEDSIGLLKLRAIFAAGHNANQVELPDGPFGALHVGAGGGGAPADDLRRWGPATQAGIEGDVQLEATYDLAMLNALDRWNRDHELPEVVMDEAKALRSFEGFTGTFDGGAFPTYGWWKVTLNGPTLDLDFWHQLPDGAIEDRYRIWFDPGNGWTPRH